MIHNVAETGGAAGDRTGQGFGLCASHYVAPIQNMQSIGEQDHVVQFYDREEYLIHTVGAFVAHACVEGEAAIVIATRDHRNKIDERLKKAGADVSARRARGLYWTYDAETLLSQFMVNGRPDPRRFRALLGPAIEMAAKYGNGVRAFGEMVALLWAQGKQNAAIELEHLWNDLADHHRFALLCAYPIGIFSDEEKTGSMRHVCRAHSCVIPHESYLDS